MKSRKKFSMEPSEGEWRCKGLDFKMSASQNEKINVFQSSASVVTSYSSSEKIQNSLYPRSASHKGAVKEKNNTTCFQAIKTLISHYNLVCMMSCMTFWLSDLYQACLISLRNDGVPFLNVYSTLGLECFLCQMMAPIVMHLFTC